MVQPQFTEFTRVVNLIDTIDVILPHNFSIYMIE